MRARAATYYRELASKVAERSTMRHRVGCVIVDRRQCEHVVAWNRWLGDPDGQGWSLHAEVWAALRAEEWGMESLTAFVARHNHRLARPCPKCLEVLRHSGVRTITYTSTPGEWKEITL